MKNNHKITVYTNYEEYRKFCLIVDEIERKLELITNMNIYKHYIKTYQPEGIMPILGEIQIVGNTTEDNANYIKNEPVNNFV